MGRPRKTDEQNAFNVALGARIAKLRAARGMGPVELARSVGISYSALYNYECGIANVPLYLLPLIAHAVGADVASLVPVLGIQNISENSGAEATKSV